MDKVKKSKGLRVKCCLKTVATLTVCFVGVCHFYLVSKSAEVKDPKHEVNVWTT